MRGLSCALQCRSWLGDPSGLIYSFQRHGGAQRRNESTGPLGRGDAAQPDADTPFEWSDRTVAGAVVASVCALLANAAGLGGKCTVLCASLASETILTVRQGRLHAQKDWHY